MVKPRYIFAAVVVAGVCAAGLYGRTSARAPEQSGRGANSTAAVTRRDFTRSVRLNGTVEAVQATIVTAPRLAGQNNSSLVIMRLVGNGRSVQPGDTLVEFDRQDQLRNALDRRAELTDFESQIKKREADEVAAKASDDSKLKQAESAQEKARLGNGRA